MGKKTSRKKRRNKTASCPVSKKTAPMKINQKEPTISLCMIVKNEEVLLPQCLESVKDYVDEMIIVDTGSTDKTIEIAESFGARVYIHPWENDFSKHRNQSISYATGDWILQLDADEELVAGSGQVLQDTVREGVADYYICQWRDIDKNGVVKSVYNQIRLYRNRMQMVYTQKVHNQLQVRGKGDYSHIRCNHYGYDLSNEKMAEKHLRTTTLLKEMLQADPDNAYYHYQLSASYSMNKEYEKSIEHGEKALDLTRRKKQTGSFLFTAYYLVAQAYYTLDDYTSAERICLEALDSFDMHIDACAILSTIYFKQQSIDQCRSISFRYIDIYEKLDKDPSLIGSGCSYCYNADKRSDVYMGLGCIHFFEKDYKAAEAYFKKAYTDSGNRMELSENLYSFYLKQRIDEKAMKWLTAAYEAGCSKGEIPGVLQNNPGLYIEIGRYYLNHDDPDSAFKCLESIQDNQITLDQQIENRLLQIKSLWVQNSIEDLVTKMESLMLLLGLDTDRCLDSFDDLGNLFYKTAEVLAEQQKWQLAEPTLNLATQIAPNLFRPEKYERLLVQEGL